MLTTPVLAAILAAAGGLGIGYWVGRHTSPGNVRARELETDLEDLRKEHEISLAEMEAARHEWKRTQAELERYKGEVIDHFTGTSELLRDLTVQYREVYDHLTHGARLLCPEGSIAVGAAEETPVLPPGADEGDPEDLET